MRQLPRHQHRNLGLIIGLVLVITLSVLAIFGPRASEARHSSVDAKTSAPATSNASTAQQQQAPRTNAPTATAFWDGGGANNNWSTATNWSPDVAPVDGSDLVFPAFVPLNSLSNNNDISGLDVNSISISGGSYHLGGNAITLSNDISVFQAPGTTSQIDLDISGTGTLTKLGTGTLILTGANTYTGLTTVSAGILDLGGGGTTGSLAGNIATNAELQFNHSNGAHYVGDISGSGSVVLLDGTLSFTGALNHTGGTTISAGTTLQEQTNGSIAGNVTNNGNLSFADGSLPTYAGVISGTGKLNQSVGTLTLTGANTYTGGTDIVGPSTLQIGNGGATGSVAGNIFNNSINSSGLIFNHSGGASFAGVISGPGNVTKLGAGTLSLTGANSYTGTTTVSAGALQIGAGGTSGSLVSNVVDNSNLIFNRSDAATYAGVISGTGIVTKLSANTLTLTGESTLTGLTTISAGILDLGGGGATGSIAGNIATNAVLQFNHSNGAFYGGDTSGTGSVVILNGSLGFSGALNHTGGTTINAGTTLQELTSASIAGNVTNNGVLSFANGDVNTYAGVISGTGQLTVIVGTLTLTGNNTYTGVTSILASPAVLLVNGNNLASPVNLTSGRLGGTGTVGPITATGGTVAPGNSPGILTTNSNLSFNAAATFNVEIGGTTAGTQYDRLIFLGSTASLGGGNLTGSLINGFIPAPGTQFTIMSAPDGGIFSGQFAQGNSVTISGRQFSIAYNAGSVVLTAGAPTAADGFVSGNIAAIDGTPVSGAVINLTGSQSRKTITDANGNYFFDAVETGGFYTVTPARVNYNFNPFNRSFSQLGNKTEAVFTATSTGHHANPLDTPEYFVRQHYLDFLGREPDEAGFNFWSDQMIECGADADCLERRRINVSAAYFLSIEFQETGGLVDGLYRASYGRRPLYVEFVPDSLAIAREVVVGRTGWEEQLERNKQAFVDAWVQRAAFIGAYGNLADDDYVDQLIKHTGVNYTASERAALVAGLTNGLLTRAAVLRQIVENQSFVRAKRNQAFVMMQYFGYLRRDPDEGGYQFWLNKLNEFNGNFEQAEMVKAFLVSGEYRQRFASQ
jgi:autotransporter-associated beta strand protein